MSNETALIPIEEKQVDFYGDDLTAALVQLEGNDVVYVPLRPICNYLGIDWAGQRQRIMRDPVLSEVVSGVVITPTPPFNRGNKYANPQEMTCLPLDYLNGWLFGINAARVKEELRGLVIRYQKECYQILARAFIDSGRVAAADSPAVTSLTQIREMARAIMEMAEQQIEYERRITTTESRLDKAAVVVGQIQTRLTAVERKLTPGNPITDEQAQEIQAAVHALAMLLTEQDRSKNHFQGIFNELHRRFGVTSYKLIPQSKYPAVLTFLEEWRERVSQ